MSGTIVVTSRSEEFREDDNGEPVVFDPGRVSRGPFWLVYFILFQVTLAAIFFVEALLNNSLARILMLLGSSCLDRCLCHGEAVARYGCNGVAFNPRDHHSGCRNSSRCISSYQRPKPMWSRSLGRQADELGDEQCAIRTGFVQKKALPLALGRVGAY